MTRYIDTEIIAKIVFEYWKECERIERIIPTIKRAIIYHSTADVVKVVRCKDCRFWKTKTEPIGIECEPGEDAHYCDMDGMITRTFDFCSYGYREKKTGKAGEKEQTEYEEQQGKSRREEGSGDPEA